MASVADHPQQHQSSTEWIPSPVVLNEIITLLRQADSPNSEVQRKLAEAVAKLEALVDAPCYFCYLLVDEVKEVEEVRRRAGLLLKNRIADLVKRMAGPCDEDELAVLNYVKANVTRALCDKSRAIMETAGLVLAAIIGSQGVDQVPEVLTTLFALLDNPNVQVVSGAFSAFTNIMEDELEHDQISKCNSPTNSTSTSFSPDSFFANFCSHKFIPKMIHLAMSPESSLLHKKQALVCLNLFQRYGLFSPTEIFAPLFESYWNCLGVSALEHSPEIRLVVLQGMVHIAATTPSVMINSLVRVLPFVLECLSVSQSYEVRFESLELLSQLLGLQASHAYIRETLPQ